MTRYFPEIVSRGLDRVHGRLSQPPVDIDPALGTLLALWVDARRIELPTARTFVARTFVEGIGARSGPRTGQAAEHATSSACRRPPLLTAGAGVSSKLSKPPTAARHEVHCDVLDLEAGPGCISRRSSS
jgi:hypothetical protein